MREFKYGFRVSRSGVVWSFWDWQKRLGLEHCESSQLWCLEDTVHSVYGVLWRRGDGASAGVAVHVAVTSRCQWPV